MRDFIHCDLIWSMDHAQSVFKSRRANDLPFDGNGLGTHDSLYRFRVGALFQLIRYVRLRGETIHEGMAWHT